MPAPNAYTAAIQLLIYQNSNFALVGDATGLRGSTTAGSLFASLHSADPGLAGDQTTSEIAYTGYARQAVARSSAGFTASANQITNAAAITFPICTLGSATATHVGIGTSVSGAGVLIRSSAIGSTSLPVAFTGNASDDKIRIPGQTYAVSDKITFFAIPGSTLPAGVVHGTIYFVKTSSGDDITISATDGGATIDITANGGGVSQKVVSLAISINITPNLSIGAFQDKAG